MRQHWWRWIPAILWCGWIYYATSSPAFGAGSTRAVFGVFNFVARTGAHVAVFGLLALLVRWAAGPGRWSTAGAWAFATIYGATDEIHQAFVPGRGASIEDVFLDSAGAAVALLLLTLWERRRIGR